VEGGWTFLTLFCVTRESRVVMIFGLEGPSRAEGAGPSASEPSRPSPMRGARPQRTLASIGMPDANDGNGCVQFIKRVARRQLDGRKLKGPGKPMGGDLRIFNELRSSFPPRTGRARSSARVQSSAREPSVLI